MPIWMKSAAAVMLIAGLAMAAVFAKNLRQEALTFAYPHPRLSGHLHVTCFEPHNARSAQQNADLAYATYAQLLSQNPSERQPSTETFAEVAARVVHATEDTFNFIEEEYGCSIERVR